MLEMFVFVLVCLYFIDQKIAFYFNLNVKFTLNTMTVLVYGVNKIKGRTTTSY